MSRTSQNPSMLPSCLRDSFLALSSDWTKRFLSPVGHLNPNMAQRDLRHDSHAALDWVTPQLVLLRKDKGNRNKSLLHRSPSRLIPTLPRPQTNPSTLTACCVTVLVCQHVCANTSVSTGGSHSNPLRWRQIFEFCTDRRKGPVTDSATQTIDRSPADQLPTEGSR